MRRRARVLTLVLALVTSTLTGVTSSAPAHAAGNVDFRGVWGSSPGGWDITSENLSTGDCAGTTDFGGDYTLVNCHVSGNTYVFDVDCCTSYVSHNNGTITGDTVKGHFHDTNGTDEDYTATRVQTAKLTVAMSLTIPPGGLGVGDTLAVPVTLSASGGDLTGVGVGTGLEVTGPVTATKVPKGTSGLSLKDGTSRSFTWEVKATAPGTVTLGLDASGTTSSGTTITGADAHTFPVSSRALTISIKPLKPTLALKATDDGKVTPQDLDVKVTFTNTTKVAIKNVSLQSLTAVPADPSQQLDKLKVTKGLKLPGKVGTVKPGKPVAKTFTFKVTGDGDYLFQALALYDDPSQAGGNGRAYNQGGPFTATVPLLYFKASDGSSKPPTVTGGGSWTVTGEVRNLSSFQTLCVPPLLATFTGNAAGLGARLISLTEPAPPLAGALAPGAYMLFSQGIATSADGSTRGSIDFKPSASLGQDGDDCNVVAHQGDAPIAASKIKVKKDSTSFYAHVDNSNPPKANGGALEFFGSFAQGSAGVLARGYEGTLALAREYGNLAALKRGLSSLSPGALATRVEGALAQLDQSLELTADFWQNTTAAEKQAFLAQVSDDVVAKTGKVWDGATAAIQKAAQGWFEGVVSAYYAGDTTAVFKALGAKAPDVLSQVAIDTAKFEVGLAIIKKGAQLTGISRRVSQTGKAITRFADLVAGQKLTLDEMGRLWGLAAEDVTEFSKIAKAEDVVIGVRGRAPISVTNLEEGAVWKHENLKPKNVKDIDIKYLGFDKADDGLVAFRSYTQQDKLKIFNKIKAAGLDAEQEKAVLARAKVRFDEAPHYLKKIEAFSEAGEIDVGFNYRGNGLDVDTTTNLRGFNLESEKLKSGASYYRPLQENPAYDALASGTGPLPSWCQRMLAKVLCRVTGDMDGVYITDTSGKALTEAKRLKVYEALAKVGWQHPETLTWVKDDGTFLFKAKTSILQGLEKGGEAMVEFAPDGVQRATYLDLKKSALISGNNFYLSVDGGYRTL